MAEGNPGKPTGGPSGIRGFLDRLDTAVDSALNRRFDPTKPVLATEEAKRAGRFAWARARVAGRAAGKAGKQIQKIDRKGRLYLIDLALMEGRKSPVERIVRHPKLVVALCLVVSALLTAPAVFIFGAPQLGIQSGMRA